MIASNGFIYALQESHLPGVIICVILFLLSAFSWTVMITKFLMIKRAKKQTSAFLERFRQARGPVDPYADDEEYEGSPIYSIYRSGCRELTFQLLGSSTVDATLGARLQRSDKASESQMETIGNSMDRAVGEVALRLEGQMTLLATVVSGAPFLGLLGTVWGVMETFSGIASAGAGASLQSMSPGVSAALVTTVIALLVAIPAKFGYNFLVNSIRCMIVRMDNFSAELASAFQRHYVDHGRRFEALPSMTAMGAVATEGAMLAAAGASSSSRSSARTARDKGETDTLPGFDSRPDRADDDAMEGGENADTAPAGLKPVIRRDTRLAPEHGAEDVSEPA